MHWEYVVEIYTLSQKSHTSEEYKEQFFLDQPRDLL